MKNTKLLLLLLILAAASLNASANLCRDSNISDRDRQEAAHLATLRLSDGSFAGNRDYDALIIGCNRKRDSRGKMVEESFQPTDKFRQNLSPRLIKGTINYYGKFPVRYGYELERVSGEWIVTMPLKFDFDNSSNPNTQDIPLELAAQLGLDVPGGVCDSTNIGSLPLNSVTGNGVIRRSGSDHSCRVSKNIRLGDGRSIQTHLANFWTTSINEHWTRPGIFKMNTVNYDDLNGNKQSRYLSAKSYWNVKFNSRPQSRALYKPIIGKPTPLYSGEAASVIVHEVGHAFGLDDEYREGSNKPWRVCSDRGGDDYIMCEMPSSAAISSTTVKAVYPWIITRRYEAETCKADSDCGDKEYCATGAIKNHCEVKRSDGDRCSADKQCGAGLSCVNKPIGSCVFEASLSLGDSCRVNEQCTTGKCQGTGNSRQCVCNTDSQCPNGTYCRNNIGQNECRVLHSEYSSCTSDSQCGTGLTCNNKPLGHCINPSSKSMGQACEYNAECTTGRCQGKAGAKQCSCANDADCTNGICIVGTLTIGKNYCRATTSTSCPSGWSYETRNPLNKDRCNRTTTQTSALKCKLLVTDKAKNWTGPHAQSGADECRSKKGKKPKGVKCSSGYRHNVRSGADTCTKSNTEHQTPSCPSGWDYKSQSGRDICQDK